MRAKESLVSEDQTWTVHEEGALLAAALAATLVEYRRHVRQNTSEPEADVTGRNWRMVARLQQLRG